MKERTQKLSEGFFDRWPALAPDRDAILKAYEMILTTYQAGGKLLLCGNGGSCADCDHIVGELMKGFLLRRPLTDEQKDAFMRAGGECGARIAEKLQQGLPAIALSAHPALVTAFCNDVDPDLIYAQQVIGYGRTGDLLIGISTSGNAKNVAAAVIAARAAGVATLGLSGRDGGELARLCDLCLVMPERETFRIQEYHIAVYHLLCAAVESELFEC